MIVTKELGKLDTEFKAKWVAALRSGVYKQGVMKLKQRMPKSMRHCCLGVACEVAEIPLYENEAGVFRAYDERADKFESSIIPLDQAELLGFTDEVQAELWHMNDREFKTFDEIADWVEENL